LPVGPEGGHLLSFYIIALARRAANRTGPELAPELLLQALQKFSVPPGSSSAGASAEFVRVGGIAGFLECFPPGLDAKVLVPRPHLQQNWWRLQAQVIAGA
jgi:hypothetical protein